jgi:hypothetical protein
MAPSSAPNRTGICVYRRCRVHWRCGIERIFFNDHWGRRHNDRSRFLDNDRRRSPILVAWNFAIARYL